MPQVSRSGADTGSIWEREPASFRDRDSFVFSRQGRIYRALGATGTENWRALASSWSYGDLVAEGLLIQSREAGSGGDFGLPPSDVVLEHPAIPSISYPYEWSFGMLKDAALLQLELLQRLAADGFVLKDGTSYNVQWRGARPVFIDVGSLSPLRSTRLWEGYRQFCRTNLYPLLLQAVLDVDFRPFLRGRLQGPTARETSAMLGLRGLARPGVLTHVHLHAAVERRPPRSFPLGAVGPETAALIRRNAAGLRRCIEKLTWDPGRSEWSQYGERGHYAEAELQQKQSFLQRIASRRRWRLAWDIGCNDGMFSRIAAEHARQVIALDLDPLTIERLYRALKAESSASILPLCLDIADPSPAQGWRGREWKRLEERAPPDLVLCLAVIHHLVIGANLPLCDVVSWLRQLDAVVILEWVDRSDPMVSRMLATRRDVFSDYTREGLDAALARHFHVEEHLRLEGGTRALLLLRPRGG